MSNEPTEDRASNQDEESQVNQENNNEVNRWKTTIRELRKLQKMYEAQLKQKAQREAQQVNQEANQNVQQANQQANQENKEEKSEEEKELEELHKFQKLSAESAFHKTFSAPRELVRGTVKGYTEKYLRFPHEEEIPPGEEEEEEEQRKWQEQKQKLQELINLPLRERLKRAIKRGISNTLQGLKRGASSFARKKAPILARKTVESVPLPPTPYGEVETFVEKVVISVPESREKNLLMTFAMQAGMYGIAVLLVFADNIIATLLQQWQGWLILAVMIPVFIIYLITSFLMWLTLYFTTFSSISAIFTVIASKIWTRGNYHRTLSPRAIVYYALAMVLYMATVKVWVGIAAGYFMALPSFLFFTLVQNAIFYAMVLIGVLTIGHIIAGVVALIWAIIALIYITFFLAFSILSMFWSKYITNSMDIHRPLAVWLILAARELLAPQIAYLAAAGFAIYAGIQAALSVGTQNSNYRYLNMLPAVIILAVAPTGTVNMLSQMVIDIVDQAFQYMASYDNWNVLMVAAQGLAKWILSVIPPW